MSDYAELVLRLENHGAFFTKIAKSHEPIDKEEALEDAAVYFDAALAIVTLRTERDRKMYRAPLMASGRSFGFSPTTTAAPRVRLAHQRTRSHEQSALRTDRYGASQ